MTIKNKATGQWDEVQIGGKTVSFRVILLLLVLSGTPLGDKAWNMLGVTREVNAPSLARVEKRLDSMDDKIDDINSDVHKLSARVTGFQVDFDKFKSRVTP